MADPRPRSKRGSRRDWLGSAAHRALTPGRGLQVLALSLSILGAAGGVRAGDLPSAPVVVSGAAGFSATPGHLNINQTTGKAIINWSDFSIAEGAGVTFNNGSGATLNRVTGTGASSLNGRLDATGSVYVINPNGIIFGKNGVVNTGGHFVASTLDLTNESFLSGKGLKFQGPSKARILNQGTILSTGGNVALLGTNVENQGQLLAPAGTVAMGAGSSLVLADGNDPNGGLLSVEVGTQDASLTNSGLIEAVSAELRAQGGNIYALAGNATGVIRATGVENRDGRIMLFNEGGKTSVAGVLEARAADGGAGHIETSGTVLDIGTVKVDTHGGTWLLDPTDLDIDATAAASVVAALNAGTNVTQQTGTPGQYGLTSAGNGDIFISSPMTWTGSGVLTLNAFRHVIFHADVLVDGPGGVVIDYGNGNSGGDLRFASGNSLQFGAATPGQSLTINGQAYTLVRTLPDLIAETTANPAGRFALANGLSQPVSPTFYPSAPIAQLNGTLEGLGNRISNLTVHNPSANYMALVGILFGTVRDLVIDGGGIYGQQYVGSIAGVNQGGSVINVRSTAVIYTVYAYGGGLVGWNTGLISRSLYNSSLIGIHEVTSAAGPQTQYQGGLAGFNTGTIRDSQAQGEVRNGDLLGGITGRNSSTGVISNVISNSLIVPQNAFAQYLDGIAPIRDAGSVATNAVYAPAGTTLLTALQEIYPTGPFTRVALVPVNWTVADASSDYGTLAILGSASLTGVAPADTANVTAIVGVTTVLGVPVTVTSRLAAGTYKQVVTGLSGSAASGYTLAPSGNTMGTLIVRPLALTGSISAGSSIYGASLTPGTLTFTNLLSGDVVTGGTVVVDTTGLTSASGNLKAGTHTGIQSVGTTLSGAAAANYTFAGTTGDYTVQTATLTPSLTGTVTRDYDATRSATLTAGNYSLAGVVSGDTVTLNNPTSGTFDTKTVGTTKTITVTGLALAGADRDNYAVDSSVSGAIGRINTKTITAALTGQVTKTYDRTTSANLIADNYALTGVESGDTVTLAATSGAYDTALAGSGKSVSFTGVTTGGTDGGNYAIASSLSGTNGLINTKTLTAGLTGTVTKTYDGNRDATLAAGNYSLTGVISGDTVALNNPTSGTYDTKTAVTGKTVDVAGLALTGADKDNYNVAATVSGAVGQIDTKTITAALTGTVTKTYDGNNSATLVASNYALTGVVSGDVVTLSAASGTYDTRNVGTGKTVDFAGVTTGSTDGANYAIASTLSGTNGRIDAKSLTAGLTGTVTKDYDGNATATLGAGNYTLTGVVGGDAVSLNNPTSGTYDTKTAGSAKTVSVTGIALTGSDKDNYTVGASASGAVGLINTKLITAALTGVVTKTYDGNRSASLVASNYALTGVVSGDTVSIGATSGLYDTRNAGSAKGVTFTGVTTGGTDGTNYSIASSLSGSNGLINTKTLTASLTGSVSKTYDGNTTATLAAGSYLLTGVVSGDGVVLNNPTSGTYDTRVAGTAKTVTVTGLAISGADFSNYTLATSVSGAVGQITAKTLTAGLTGTVVRTYDGTRNASLVAGNYTLTGAISGDAVALNNPTSGLFDTKTVGLAKTITVSGLALTGADRLNYSLPTTVSGAIGQINTKLITAVLSAPVIKIYDGNSSAVLADDGYTFSGLVTGDTVTLEAVSGRYDTKAAGTGKLVTFSGLVTAGTDGANYTIAPTLAGGVGQILPKALSAFLTGSVTKTYDGTTAATLSASNYVLNGVVSGDAVTLNSPTSGLYATKTAGAGKTVTASGLSLAGADQANYTVAASVSGAVGLINTKLITASLTSAVIKPYDGTVSASLGAGGYSLTGVVSGDTVTLTSGSGAYDTKAVGTGKTVSFTGVSTSGADGANYSVASTMAGTVGQIDPRLLTAALTGSVTKTYDGNTSATLSASNYVLNGVVSGEVVDLSAPTTGTYDTKTAGTGKSVSVSGLGLGGADKANYTIATTASGAIGQINRKDLTAVLNGPVVKVYDGTTSATLATGSYGLSGLVSGDSVSLTPGSGAYDSKTVGSAKTVTFSGLAGSGPDGANYNVTSTLSGAVGQITPKALTTALTGTVTKTYDGTTVATLSAGNYALTGVVSGDAVALNNPASGTYDTKAAGTGKTVAVSGLAISGADSANYTVTSSVSGAVGQINRKDLTATLTGPITKTYDGTVTAALSAGSYSLSGVVGGDAVSLSAASGAYDTKTAGSAKTVTFSGLAPNGADGANYVVNTTISATVGQINRKPLTASLTGTVSKTYDGNASATLAPENYALTGVVSGDAVTMTTPSEGTYDSEAVGSGKTVSVSGLGLSGADVANYTLSEALSGVVGRILPAPFQTSSLVVAAAAGSLGPASSASAQGPGAASPISMSADMGGTSGMGASPGLAVADPGASSSADGASASGGGTEVASADTSSAQTEQGETETASADAPADAESGNTEVAAADTDAGQSDGGSGSSSAEPAAASDTASSSSASTSGGTPAGQGATQTAAAAASTAASSSRAAAGGTSRSASGTGVRTVASNTGRPAGRAGPPVTIPARAPVNLKTAQALRSTRVAVATRMAATRGNESAAGDLMAESFHDNVWLDNSSVQGNAQSRAMQQLQEAQSLSNLVASFIFFFVP